MFEQRRRGGEEDSRPSVTPHRSAAFNYQYSCLSPPPEHPQILREILEGVFFTFFGNSFCFTGPESTIQKQTNNIVETRRKRDNTYENGVSDGYWRQQKKRNTFESRLAALWWHCQPDPDGELVVKAEELQLSTVVNPEENCIVGRVDRMPSKEEGWALSRGEP